MDTKRLILLNLAVYAALKLAWLLLPEVPADFEAILAWIALPSDAVTLLTRPWTILTYSVVQVDFLHLLVNMLWLWWFGAILGNMRGGRAVGITYLIGALAGGAVYAIEGFFMAGNGGELTGASAATAAIVTAVTLNQPRYPVHLFLVGRVPLWLIAPVALLSFFTGDASTIAVHFAGVAVGVAVWYRWRHQYKAKTEQVRRMMQNTARRNVILEKARTSGFASLTDDERRQLFDMTPRHREAGASKT